MESAEFIQDVNEPREMIALLAPVVPFQIQALNSATYADYRWTKLDGSYKQVERKTWGELLANTDKVEEQLHRHLTKHNDIQLVFLLEGLVQQDVMGTVILNKTRSGIYVKGHRYSARLKGIYSWLYQISQYCQVVQTTSLLESATALVSMYEADQKELHNTLHRHIKQVEFTTNPMVTSLMGASIGLGNIRASKLIDYGGTPFNIFTAGWTGTPAISTWQELTLLDGIGETIVKNTLRNIGRPDV